MPRIDILPLLLALAAASFACRAGGFWIMRFVPVTPRVRAVLAAAPLAVMAGIVTPAAMRGGVWRRNQLIFLQIWVRRTGRSL